jgi:type IV pilus assembly protein PilA
MQSPKLIVFKAHASADHVDFTAERSRQVCWQLLAATHPRTSQEALMHSKLAKLREERANGDRGFTLIELLVVVVIIGILIAIAIPLYLNYKKGANDKSAQSDVRNAIAVLEQCNTDNGGYPSALGTAAGNSYAALVNCGTAGDQRVNFSGGTTLTYGATPSGCTTACTGFTLAGTNSGGANKTYTYDSATGQTVTT